MINEIRELEETHTNKGDPKFSALDNLIGADIIRKCTTRKNGLHGKKTKSFVWTHQAGDVTGVFK